MDIGGKLIVATHNSHKTGEIREIIGEHFDEVIDLTEFPEIKPAIEDGDTFEANAIIKALHGAKFCPGAFVLADDSGLEVDALGLAPGIYSARYAGEDASDAENRDQLLVELGEAPDRAGRFRCVLAFAKGEEVLHTCSGTVEGTITHEVQGEGGFGYDPIFIPEGYEQSFGLLPSEVKHSISHRGDALREFLKYLR